MANLHRVRVCMVGSEKDMLTLCQVLLDNYDGIDPEEEEIMPSSLDGLIDRIYTSARTDGAEFDTFLYRMISDIRFGDAEPGTLRFDVKEQLCGLWTACFAYDSSSPFQVHEWLDLHKRTGGILTVAQRASWDFGNDKGEIIFTAGQVLDNWDDMGECWLWLLHQYECGYPPEEAVDRLLKLEKTLIREDFDMTVDELLQSCGDHLRALEMTLQDQEEIRKRLEKALQTHDYISAAEIQHMVAEGVLWDIERNAKWLATLQAVRTLWQERNQ